jgi:hypothetical protein
MIINYDRHLFIVQATDLSKRKMILGWLYENFLERNYCRIIIS